MNITMLKQNVALLCITMLLAALVQPVLAGNLLPPLVPLYETELILLADPDQADQTITLSGTLNEGGPYTVRSFYLMVPGENGESELLTASYAGTVSGEDVQVTINAGGEIYNFINFLQSREEVDDFFARYLDRYYRYHGHGADGEFHSPVKPGASVPDRMMHFFTWLDEQLLIAEDREYGFARKFAWMRSETYAKFIPHAAGLLSQVSYAQESVVENAWVKTLTFQDLTAVFDSPILQVLDRGFPVPERNEMESFSLGLVPLEANQPMGGGDDWGFNDYFDCWNETWTGRDCRACCGDWYSAACAICAIVTVVNPPLGMVCFATASSGYIYCRVGCGLANPGVEQGWSGGA